MNKVPLFNKLSVCFVGMERDNCTVHLILTLIFKNVLIIFEDKIFKLSKNVQPQTKDIHIQIDCISLVMKARCSVVYSLQISDCSRQQSGPRPCESTYRPEQQARKLE